MMRHAGEGAVVEYLWLWVPLCPRVYMGDDQGRGRGRSHTRMAVDKGDDARVWGEGTWFDLKVPRLDHLPIASFGTGTFVPGGLGKGQGIYLACTGIGTGVMLYMALGAFVYLRYRQTEYI